MKVVTMLVLLACLSGCAFVKDSLTRPTPEKPPPKEDQYLSKGSISNELDLGPDQKFLLDEFATLKSAKIALENQLGEMRATNEGLRSSLKQAEDERDKVRRLCAGAEGEGERLRKLLHDRDSKILSLSMEKARLQREALLLRIAGLERQLEEQNAAAAADAAAEPNGK